MDHLDRSGHSRSDDRQRVLLPGFLALPMSSATADGGAHSDCIADNNPGHDQPGTNPGYGQPDANPG